MTEQILKRMRRDALEILKAGIEAVEPGAAIKHHCRIDETRMTVEGASYELSRTRRIYVLGAGKAGAPMAKALEELLGGRIHKGLINVKYGHLAELKTVEINEAGHPVPDPSGIEGAARILQIAEEAERDDLIVCVISGGGSALLPLPVEGISLEEKQETTKVLLGCGATIHEINAVRKHISRIKGGGLARASHPARLLSLILSDVIGDDLDTIASGPTVPDSSTYQDCLDIFERYGILDKIPQRVLEHIRKGARGEVPETPKTGDKIFEGTKNVIVASNLQCLRAAQKKASELGYNTLLLSTMIEGETKEAAKVHAGIAKEILNSGHPIGPPACVLSGGETTVTLDAEGLGGRNQEFVLAAGIALEGHENIVVLSAGTDGTDGPTDAAGAIADGLMVSKAAGLGLSPTSFLSRHDSYHFFERMGDLVKTGPTNTNVMDLRIFLVRR